MSDNSTTSELRHWDICFLCGCTVFDGAFCRNCHANSGHRSLLIALDTTHCRSAPKTEWTLCGIWIPPEEHPVCREQKITNKRDKITCQECNDRVDRVEEDGHVYRERPL